MAAEWDGNEVTQLEETQKFATPPLFCGDPIPHDHHPYRLEAPRTVHGAMFPTGLAVWCEGRSQQDALTEHASLHQQVPDPYREPDVIPEPPAEETQFINNMTYDLREMPIFGVADDQGNILLEFRIRRDGTLDARYYEDDLSPAALQFVKHLQRMAGRDGSQPT